jgi:KipI family sensor histidine kinase inhibitor
MGEKAHYTVMSLQKELQKELPKSAVRELVDIVPAFNSLSLYFSTKSALEAEIDTIKKVAYQVARTDFIQNDTAPKKTDTTSFEIPVCYELPYAPDIPFVMEQIGLSHQEIIEYHHHKKYTVYMNGFVPGFSYMGTLDPLLQLPRKQVPTPNVPPGSVAIAANQTGIYPVEVPGGWHVIGKTPLKMFDKKRSPACLLSPGDTVTFKPITAKEFEHWI